MENNSPAAIAVLRDTSTGACHLTDFELDIERLEACGYELAGYLANPQRVTLNNSEDFDYNQDDSDTPEFTTCEAEDCSKWIMIDEEGGAPTYCTEHSHLED